MSGIVPTDYVATLNQISHMSDTASSDVCAT